MQAYEQNSLTCLQCKTVLEAPRNDRQINECKCWNKAWIQKRPDGEFWAYGSLNPMLNQRNLKKKD